ncbi:MAG: cupin domain-containing protein [Alphaproteobacteria bacterium]|nr:cupin domain-containing protein [Alphaproteobacteria bacterium]
MTEKIELWNPGEDLAAFDGQRRKALAGDDYLTVARIVYQPGESNDFHRHDGTSQALLVVKGEFTVRTRHADGSVTEKTLREGEAALVGNMEFEQFENTGDEPALVFQVLQPGAPVLR